MELPAAGAADDWCMDTQVVGKAGQQTIMTPTLSLSWSRTLSSQRVASTRKSCSKAEKMIKVALFG